LPSGDAGRHRSPLQLDLSAVEASLRRVRVELDAINRHLRTPRDPMSDHVIRNMVARYMLVDELVSTAVDPFAPGHHKRLLELNSLGVCGTAPARRAQYAQHLAATERRFYEDRNGGIRELVEWYARHRRDSAWKRAAGAYTMILGQPQLFIEGNHRTGALVMSYILLTASLPPFVLSVDNAVAYFTPSAVIRDTPKHGVRVL